MHHDCGERPLLGTVLVQHGELTIDEVERALATQLESDDRLGEILVELGVTCRPAVDRALAKQSGIELQLERGYGTGLRAEIERRHRARRGLKADPASA